MRTGLQPPPQPNKRLSASRKFLRQIAAAAKSGFTVQTAVQSVTAIQSRLATTRIHRSTNGTDSFDGPLSSSDSHPVQSRTLRDPCAANNNGEKLEWPEPRMQGNAQPLAGVNDDV